MYKQLSLHRKEDLLSQIAFTTFERSEYFFKQSQIEAEIRDYIRNLPNARTDAEALQVDSEAALQSIESQHGLMVEQSRGIYTINCSALLKNCCAIPLLKTIALSSVVKASINKITISSAIACVGLAPPNS